jgi:hypothetical protein
MEGGIMLSLTIELAEELKSLLDKTGEEESDELVYSLQKATNLMRVEIANINYSEMIRLKMLKEESDE